MRLFSKLDGGMMMNMVPKNKYDTYSPKGF